MPGSQTNWTSNSSCLLVDAGNRNVREVANTRGKEPLSRRLRPVQVSARLRQRAPEPPTFSGDALASGFWFYKKGCQGKKFPRELEAAKSFGIQPPCRCAGASRRSSARVVWLKDSEMFRCQGHRFPNLLSLLLGKVFAERPGAVKGAPFRRGRSEPLTARTVLRRFTKRERRSSNSIRFLKRNKRNGCMCMWQP